MRMMSLFILFFGALYYFLPREEKGQSIDSVRLKLSSLRKEAPVKRSSHLPQLNEKSNTVTVSEEEEIDPDADYANEDDHAKNDEIESIPWEDIEKGWENEVKEALIRLDPEDGETIYNSYLQEKENHKSEIDSLFSQNQDKSGVSRAPSLAPSEADEAIGSLDQKHEERLKEILGAHYDEISKRHQEYLNPSSIWDASPATRVSASLFNSFRSLI